MEGNDQWTLKELVQAACIMAFSHFASSFALANGINPEDSTPIPTINFKNLETHINWHF
jgi:hypothetical protein